MDIVNDIHPCLRLPVLLGLLQLLLEPFAFIVECLSKQLEDG
jgi:hypothetical protein